MLYESAIFDEKLINRIEILYTPVRSTPNVGVWDLVNQYFGSLDSNSGVWVEEDFKDQFLFAGGLEGILPILNLIRNRITCDQQGKQLLQRYLELVSQSIQVVNGHSESKIRFIKAFFLLLENIPRDFFQIKTIQLLAEIRFSLSSDCRHQFFLSLLHSADIWINCSTSIQKEFWAFVNDIYLQDPEYYHGIFSIPELVDFSLKLSEAKDGIVHTTQRLSPKFKRPDTKEEAVMKDLSLILSVVEKLFVKGGDFVSENIKYLTPALTSKASATFKYEILKLLKVLLVDTEEDSVCPSPLVFAEHFVENCGMHILLYLCINSPLDVISMCLKLIDVLSSLKKSKKLNIDTDIIPFLSNIILAKIKEKPVITTPSGKEPQLLPSIEEELEANMTAEKQQPLMEMNETTEDLLLDDRDSINENTNPKLATQNFTGMNFGLELDVDEANKGFDSKNREEPEDPFDDAQKRESIAAKFRQEMMLDDNILNQTKEVPPGPKSKSVPRNAGFFGMSGASEESKKSSNRKNKPRSFFDPFREESKEELEEEKVSHSPDIMIESGAPLSKDNMKGVIKKRFNFLDTNDEPEEEKKEEEPIEEKKSNRPVLNPAATGATELQSDSSSERSEVLNFNKNKNQFKKPMINTEAINEMFNYGGEKGDLLIRIQDEEEKNESFLKELDDIASFCVAAMNRESPDDEVILPNAGDNDPSDPSMLSFPSLKTQNFNAPRTMRGLTQIDFSKPPQDPDPLPKSYLPSGTSIIQEEPSPVGTSKSSSSKPSFNTPTSLLAPDPQKGLKEKAALEEFNSAIQALYVSILEWMLNRSPSNLNEPLMIDDSDEIHNSNVLLLAFNLLRYSDDLLKQKALQDFQMLAKLNKSNCSHLIENKFYHPWILELLLPYQTNACQEKLTGPALAVYDIGTKFYTVVLLNSLINEPKNRYILYLARWPLIQAYNNRGRDLQTYENPTQCYQLTKHLLSSVIKQVVNEASKCRPSIDQPIWANVARIVFIIEELVLDRKPTNIMFKEGNKSIYEDYQEILNCNMIKSSENRKEFANSISKTETCVIDDIFKVLNYLWPSSLFETRGISKTKESKILDILSHISDDDFAKDAELLMYCDKDKKSPQPENRNTFLRSIVNLACLKISTISTSTALKPWLNILLRLSKYLLLTSETWTTKDTPFYKTTQSNIAESLAFIIAFLYRQLLSCSNKEMAKAFSTTLEDLMTHFLVTVNYSDIKYTPQQLKQTNHKTASKELMNNILVVTKGESLISPKILEKLRLHDYKEISKEVFSTDR